MTDLRSEKGSFPQRGMPLNHNNTNFADRVIEAIVEI
jgi:hypothetical protein